MAVNIPGLISLIVFYLIILAIGIFVGRKTAKSKSSDEVFLANRSIGVVISFFTLTATMVGGGYINGTSESMAYSGLIWTQAPFGYCLALFIGGIAYAPKMRRAGYITMFDPFQNKYGKRIGSLLFIPQLLGDLFWTAAILSALGTTVAIIIDIDETIAIVVSACIAVFYTFLGGLYSVAYTDVVQLICIAIGLFLAFPFALNHPSVDLDTISEKWLGHLSGFQIGKYIDLWCLLIFGGIPWQVYYQRVLACKSAEQARTASIVASGFCLLMAVPPMIIGVVGAAADWNQTSYTGEVPIPPDHQSFILPLVLNFLCPLPVAIIGIGAVAAAVMSSSDSCVLSTGSVFAKNIYMNIIRPKATDMELIWVLRISIVLVGTVGTVIAIMVKTVYGLFILCSDLMFVALFPQLTSVLWIKASNTYGSLLGFLLALILRVGGGEPIVGIPALIRFPLYDETHGQLFPFRTFIMMLSFLTIISVSILTNFIFNRGIVPLKYDFFRVIAQEAVRRRNVERGESILMKGTDDIVSMPSTNSGTEKNEW